MKKNIPNVVTCLNLFTGCLGIVYDFQGNLAIAAYAIVLAAIFDFFDGMLSRVLHAHSDIGKQLDSLADLISFGLLPSVIIYQLFLKALAINPWNPFISFFAFVIIICSAIRLAKFNIDTRQSENFIGLPTPANALLIASLPLILIENPNSLFTQLLLNVPFLCLFSLAMGLLLNSELHLLSLKFKNFSFDQNYIRYILIVFSIFLWILLKFIAVPILMIAYILLSIIHFKKGLK